MKTFGEWLCHYNNLDVAPFIEALQKMKGYYGEHGIDICKDAVSLAGVSLQYVLRGLDYKEKCVLYTVVDLLMVIESYGLSPHM